MKYFVFAVVILAICGAAYLRSQRPADWDKLLDSLKVNPPSSTSVAGTSTDTNAPTATSETPAPPPTKPSAVYITPDTSKFVNSSHVTDVAQPAQPNQADPSQYPTTKKTYLPPYPIPAQPNWTWTTSEGKIFNNVVIEKVEADRVTIFHDKGSAIIDMSSLSDDIQKMLNYDPDLAADALAARHKSDATTNAAPAAP